MREINLTVFEEWRRTRFCGPRGCAAATLFPPSKTDREERIATVPGILGARRATLAMLRARALPGPHRRRAGAGDPATLVGRGAGAGDSESAVAYQAGGTGETGGKQVRQAIPPDD